MRILIVGLGSMGRRYERLILQNWPEHYLFYLRSGTSYQDGRNNLFSWDQAEQIRPSCALICTPTWHHIHDITECANRGIPFLVEKPISDVSIPGLAKVNVPSYVAYPLRFHDVVNMVRGMNVDREIICKSNAKLWPGKRPKDGVLLELSHEIDYAQYVWGEIIEIDGIVGVNSDWANLRLRHKDGKTTKVWLDINSKEETRTLGGMPIKVTDEVFIRQLKYFFANLDNPEMINNLAEASILFEKIIEFEKRSKRIESIDFRLRKGWIKGSPRKEHKAAIRQATYLMDGRQGQNVG